MADECVSHRCGAATNCATVCYMRAKRKQVGVRELRQNLSVHLRKVRAGETLEVTEHGRPVAILAPIPEEAPTALERLIASGRATAPVGDLLHLGPPLGRPSLRVSRALQEVRRERM
jgi:prevent-host-death family protein